MRAFGKPGFFEQHNRMSKCYIPPNYCELQMVRVKHLAIQLTYSLPNTAVQRITYFGGRISRTTTEYQAHMAEIKKEFHELEAMLWKCKKLETLRLILRTESAGYFINDDGEGEVRAQTVDNHPDLEDLLLIFLSAASSKTFKVAADESKTFLFSTQGSYATVEIESYRDPIIRWFICRAEHLELHAALEENHIDRAFIIRFEHDAGVPRRIYEFDGYTPNTEHGV